MYTKYWQIIKDDSKRTFEVCGQDDNTNYFMNNVYGMQKAGMNVSCTTPPVAGSKDAIKIIGYTKEVGLHARLLNDYKEITRKSFGEWDEA